MRSWVRIIISRLKTFTKSHPNGMAVAAILGVIALLALPFLFLFFLKPQDSSSSASTFPLTKPFLSNSYAYENSQPELKSEFLSKKDTSHLFTATDPKSKASLSLSLNLDQSTTGHDSKSNSQNSRIESLNNQDTLVIPDILPHTDLVYHVIANGVKEEIVLKSKDVLSATESGSLTYTFSLKLSGLKTKKRDDGTILPEFKIGDSNESFQLLPLYMEDANGVTSHEVALTIEPSEIPSEEGQVGDRGVSSPITNSQSPNPILLLTVTPSMDWLSDPARTFPIRIDPSVVKGDAPVAQWGLDEGYGTTTNDGSTNLNHLTITNATWEKTSDRTSASSATYIEFDGTGDYLSRTSDADFDFGTGSFSLSGWFKHNSTAALDIIMAHTGAVDGIGWKVYLDASGYLCFGIDDDTTSFPEKSACSTSTQGSLADSRWHHFEAVKSSTTSITIYLDGKPITTTSIAGTTGTLSNSVTLHIGIDGDASTNAWTGFLDNLTIYNYERTAAQVQADALAVSSAQASVSFGTTPKDTLTDGLVGWWKMDETSVDAEGETSTDASGNANTGTLYGDDASGDDGSGMTCTASGKFGTGCDFDGVDDYVSFSSQSQTLITIAAWVKSDTEGDSDYPRVLNMPGIFLFFGRESAGADQENNLNFASDRATDGVWASPVNTIGDNQWYHIVVSYDSSSVTNDPLLYINGVSQLVSELATPIGSQVDNAGTGYIGNRSAIDRSWDGTIDDVRIYNRALSPAEVRALYNWAPGPVAYYPMDENTGTTSVNDLSGNGNTGTMNGSMAGDDWIKGKFGSSLDFDGSDDYINAGSATMIDTITSGTISLWIHPDAANAEWMYPVAKDNSGTNNGDINIAVVESDDVGGNANKVRLFISSGSTDYYVFSNSAITFNQWLHVSGTFGTGGMKFYLNGVLQDDTDANTIGMENASADLILGAIRASTGPFDGKIDEVKIYNYARTPSQIIEDMNGGHPVGGSPVGSAIGYWKFDDSSSTTAQDASNDTNNNDLTLSSASWTTSGKFGSAWNGTGATYLYRLDDADFDFTAAVDFSISGWFKSDAASNPGAIEYLVDKSSATVAGYSVYFDTSGFLCFGIDDDTTWGPDIASCTTTDVYDNAWHSFVAIRDYLSTDKTYLYVDGILKDSDSDSTTATLANSQTMYIGDDDGDATNSFAGDLDELKIYRAALTPEQVLTEYNHGKASVMGSTSTASDGITADNSTAREFCVPGDTTSCSAPVGWWKMDENTGTTSTYDSSGNGYTGTLNGTMTASDWVPGKLGTALDFDGGDDFVSVTDVSALNPTTITVEAWFNARDISGQTHPPIVKKASSTTGYSLEINNSTSALAMWIRVGGSFYSSPTYTASTNTWYHAAGTYDGTTLRLFVDGKEVSTGTAISGTIVSPTSQPLQFGQDAGNPTRFFDGQIDDVRIYNYARTPAQIAWDYNKGEPVAHYKLDECTGSTAYNSAKTGNGVVAGMNGTITIGAGGSEGTVGDCSTSSTAWYNGSNGKRNNSLDFDGTDDYVGIGDQNMVKNISGATWTAWVKPGTISGYDAIVTQHTGLGSQVFWVGLTSGYLGTCRMVDEACDPASYKSSRTVATDQWSHVALIFSGSNYLFYINGIYDSTIAAGAATILNLNAPINIGAQNNGAANFFDGQIDEVKIYNYALTAKQVQLDYNQGAVNFAP